MRGVNIMEFIKFFILLQHLVLTSGVGHHHHTRHSLLTDRAALLAFKRTIVFDPNLTLANWVDAVNVCNFTGVTCDKHHHRVVQLNLSKSELYGPLSSCISNLTGLRVLSLVENHFYGKIPHELSYLYHLRHLLLDTNNLEGPIPDTLSALANLTLVTLNQNHLTGQIPPSLFSNCTLLRNVDVSNNLLQGKIPEEIGNCPNLWNLNLYGNQFTGKLPASLINTSLYNLDVQNNYLTGELPSHILEKLVNLTFLYLSYNKMTSHDLNTNLSPFFTSLKNCTDLEEIELAGMGIGGRLPSSIGQPKLTRLILPENNIIGSIPPEIRNVSFLRELNLTFNQLSGIIPEEISQLSHLEQLFLSYNWFHSVIPATLGQLAHLGLLDLSNNKLSGEIPASLGNLVRVNSMFLNNNQLSGQIPPTLGRCIDLYRLDLSYNRLTGRIPPELSGLREIRIFLNLSHNYLDGALPIEFSKLENVQEIDVSSNNLNGSIFLQISSCTALRLLNLSHNYLQGQLPDSLGDLMSLESFDASGNHLFGIIPVSLNKAPHLTFLNLSFNNFEGTIPSGGIFNLTTNMSFLGNGDLCGTIPGIPICSQRRGGWFHSRMFLIIFVIVIFVSGFLTTICCVIGLRRIKLVISSNKIEAVKKPSTPEILNFPRITYRELSEATDGFDERRLIGTGSYGRVYKGVLPDGMAIAVKVLQLQSDFKALVLPYMANGSLDSRLYPHSTSGLSSGSSDLSLIQRVNICSDIAEGMAYLHHHSPVRVIHCDLKPSNVLLNDDMTALVSDFGIARLVMIAGVGNAGIVDNMGNSTANMPCGSVGYIAPEYGFGSNMSTKGDVYSFGILVLEMITRKRPTDEMFVGALNLKFRRCGRWQ